jgi:adenylate cyclase
VGIEIERKFLVADSSWRSQVDKILAYEQGYISSNSAGTVRVRIEGERARLNIKSAGLDIQRMEYEYPIPFADAREMLDTLCLYGKVSKQRHFIIQDKHTWELDEFTGKNSGLLVAEIELSSRDEKFELPDWLGEEVSADPRYLNNNLAKFPFEDW